MIFLLKNDSTPVGLKQEMGIVKMLMQWLRYKVKAFNKIVLFLKALILHWFRTSLVITR